MDRGGRYVDPSGVRAVALVTAASPCHLYKANRGCAGGGGGGGGFLSVSLVFFRGADVLLFCDKVMLCKSSGEYLETHIY